MIDKEFVYFYIGSEGKWYIKFSGTDEPEISDNYHLDKVEFSLYECASVFERFF